MVSIRIQNDAADKFTTNLKILRTCVEIGLRCRKSTVDLTAGL